METGDRESLSARFDLLSCPKLFVLVAKEVFDELPRNLKLTADKPDRDLIKRLDLCADAKHKIIYAFSSAEFINSQLHRLQSSGEDLKRRMITLEIDTLTLIEETRDLHEVTLCVDFGYAHSLKIDESDAVELLELHGLAAMSNLSNIYLLRHADGSPVVTSVDGWQMVVAYFDLHHAEGMVKKLVEEGGKCHLDWCEPARFAKIVLESDSEGVVIRPGTPSQQTFNKADIQVLKLVTGEPKMFSEVKSKISGLARRFQKS